MVEICQYALSHVEMKISALYAIMDDLDERDERVAVQKIQDYKNEWDDINDILLDLLKKF